MSAIEYMNWPRKLPFDSRFAEDLVGELAEERRKAAMMEVHWTEKRWAARGPLYPQPMSEQMFGFYPIGIQIDPQYLAYLENVKEHFDRLCGGPVSGAGRIG
jgi:hypothetical protein